MSWVEDNLTDEQKAEYIIHKMSESEGKMTRLYCKHCSHKWIEKITPFYFNRNCPKCKKIASHTMKVP